MKVTLKMYASLAQYLPEDASANAVHLDVPERTTPHQLIDTHGVPRDEAHLVLKNGIYVEPADRDRPCLQDGDVLALWPPVAGG